MSQTPTTSDRPWSAPAAPGPIRATVTVPGSKSESNRALLLAALADAPSVLSGVLDSRDTSLMTAGLARMGVDIAPVAPGVVRVTPPSQLHAAALPIDCGLAGTVMRFLPVVAALCDQPTRFTGDEGAFARPNRPVLHALRQLGATVEGDAIPCRVTGPITGHEVVIDSSSSSQFVSGLLLAGARMPQGLDLRHEGEPIPSRPHIEMTVAMLAERGVRISEPTPDHWIVEPGPIKAVDALIEPDLTSSAVFLAAAALTQGKVSVPGWPFPTTQPGDMVRDVLARMGAKVGWAEGTLTVGNTGPLQAVDVDLSDASELTPVVATLMAFAQGTSTIAGVAHIRGHETDRLAALETELQRIGVDCTQTDDGLRILGAGPLGDGLRPALMRAYADHRMAHVAALVGLIVPGTQLDDLACTTKTISDFDGLWTAMLEGR